MEWKDGRHSQNVQDRRGLSKAGSVGIGGLLIVLIGWALGIDPQTMLGFVENSGLSGETQQSTPIANGDTQAEFVQVMLGSNEDVWTSQLKKNGILFQPSQLILFSNQTQTPCGIASAATGPFYCPSDQRIYIDLNFIREMQRLGATRSQQIVGNFALGYVIAHEFGHHISNLIGTLPRAHQQMQAARSKAEANAISVALELQADCFAGVWAANLNHYNISISRNDIEDGLRAANAVGDDHIFQSIGRGINPENFTHGSSAQRMQWFTRGLQTGDMHACNTLL